MGARLVLDAAEVEGGGGGGTFLKQFDCESDCTFFFLVEFGGKIEGLSRQRGSRCQDPRRGGEEAEPPNGAAQLSGGK